MKIITFISLFIKRYNYVSRNNTLESYNIDDEVYSPDYAYILGIRNKKCKKICHIDIDKHGVHQDNMSSLGLKENKKVKIYKRVRKKYSYMNYPFYSSKT